MKKTIFMTFLLLVGCSETIHLYGKGSRTSLPELEQDKIECNKEIDKKLENFSSSAIVNRKQLLDHCMKSKGYAMILTCAAPYIMCNPNE